MNISTPIVGQRVKTPDGHGVVESVATMLMLRLWERDPARMRIIMAKTSGNPRGYFEATVRLADGRLLTYPSWDVTFEPHSGDVATHHSVGRESLWKGDERDDNLDKAPEAQQGRHASDEDSEAVS